jgi:hypothetical protein
MTPLPSTTHRPGPDRARHRGSLPVRRGQGLLRNSRTHWSPRTNQVWLKLRLVDAETRTILVLLRSCSRRSPRPAVLDILFAMLRRRGVIALWEPKRNSAKFDLCAAFQQAATSVATNPDALVYGDSLAMTIDDIDPGGHIRARFMTLRSKDSSPVQYDPRSGLTPINIPQGSYIADVMHLIIKLPGSQGTTQLTDGSGCIVFDRHDNGPTLGELSRYVDDFLRIPINLVSLYNRDLQKELEDMDGRLRKVEVGFLASKTDGIADDGLFGNLKALSLGEQVPSVGVSLGVGRARGDIYLPDKLQKDVMDLVGNAGEYVERMRLFGRLKSTGEIKEVNILRQRIGEHLDFKPTAGAPNMPDHHDAYGKLENMYASFYTRGLIENAISARIISRR